MGDEVKVTVVAAGFDGWDAQAGAKPAVKPVDSKNPSNLKDIFAAGGDEEPDDDDDFDVPSFLK